MRVLDAGLLTTVQDEGRLGWAHLGVARSGFLDRASARWANRLVGNCLGDAALLETTGGTVVLQMRADLWIAVTGARTEVRLDGRLRPTDERFLAPSGTIVSLGAPSRGTRSYVAVAGGVTVPAVLGSRSYDLLGQIGPAPLRTGDLVPTGVAQQPAEAAPRTHGLLPRGVFGAQPEPEVWTLRIVPGPRNDWLEDPKALDGAEFAVGAASNRVGLRLTEPRLAGTTLQIGRRPGELVSEPMVLGSVQLPPSGEPVVFLADHPTTGGYPVVALVLDEDLDRCAQMRPGDRVRLRLLER